MDHKLLIKKSTSSDSVNGRARVADEEKYVTPATCYFRIIVGGRHGVEKRAGSSYPEDHAGPYPASEDATEQFLQSKGGDSCLGANIHSPLR